MSALLTNKHVLIHLEDKNIKIDPQYVIDLNYIKTHFCGLTIFDPDNLKNFFVNNEQQLQDIIFYVCGDVDQIYDIVNLAFNSYVIKELSYNYKPSCPHIKLINSGKVPINVCNAGVYFRQLFDNSDYFDAIHKEHNFQTLTESNKQGTALRNGIYLSKVTQVDDETHFNLLRCSTNLSGPTDNFRATDHLIVDQVNNVSKHFFTEPAEFNHVLAQTYENNVTVTNNKRSEHKAKIKAHSDKTKDMPSNGLMAFCTFYKDFSNLHKSIKPASNNRFDYVYNEGHSVLTRLYFKLKDVVNDETLAKEFTVTLYPNSAFMISLLTNRLYTHEIKASVLPVDKIPVRLGYVVRCSKTKAVFKDGQTYVNANGELVKMHDMSVDKATKLKKLYFEENVTDQVINYGDLYFSMNSGDYVKPII